MTSRTAGSEGTPPPERSAKQRGGHDEISIWEWITAALAAVLLLAALGYIAYGGVVKRPETVATILIETDSIVEVEGGYVVRFFARNVGDETAASLVVEGELRDAEGTAQRSEVTIDFVPPQSRRRAALYFSRDPTGRQLRIRALGYDTR